MREILFRGKDIRGRWYYGLLAHIKGGWYISNKAGIATAYEVREETIGQYTGLTDKNGKKIFEGDIIENIDGRSIVFFDKIHCGFYMRFLDAYDDTPLDMSEMWDDTEVIGNIHDNPELLGGADNG